MTTPQVVALRLAEAYPSAPHTPPFLKDRHMALPPSPMPMPPADAAMPADMAAPADEGMEMEAPVLFTVIGPPEGPYTLMAGDEPEGEGAMAADAPTFDTPQALMKAVMELLNPAKGAEDAFAGATKSGGPMAEPPLMG